MSASKWTILMLTCVAGFGSYYAFETPSVIHDAMYAHFNFHDKAQFELYFSLIYSLYALPNMILPLFGGFLADKIGNQRVMLLVASIVLFGNFIETVAYFRANIGLFLFGRFIFGCGAETLNVCCSIIISKWFKGQELALALAIVLSLSKLATVVTDWTSPLMYRRVGIVRNAVFVTFVCLVCYLLTILLLKFDADKTKADQMGVHANRLYGDLTLANSANDEESQRLLGDEQFQHQRQETQQQTNFNGGNPNGSSSGLELVSIALLQPSSQDIEPQRRQVQSLTVNTSNNRVEREEYGLENHKRLLSTTAQTPGTATSTGVTTTTSTPPSPEGIQCTFLGFGLPVWTLFVFTLAMYGTFIPFTNWSNVLLIQFYYYRSNPSASFINYRQIAASRLQSIPNFITVFLTPVFGMSVDWFGRRAELLTLSATLLVIAHTIVYNRIMESPIVPLMLIGFSFSIFGSVIWPCVPVVVPLDHQGTAYGVMTSFQNAGQFIVPLFLEEIYRHYNSYIPCEGFFIYSSCVCTTLAVIIWVVDEWWNNAALRLPEITRIDTDPELKAVLSFENLGRNLTSQGYGAIEGGGLNILSGKSGDIPIYEGSPSLSRRNSLAAASAGNINSTSVFGSFNSSLSGSSMLSFMGLTTADPQDEDAALGGSSSGGPQPLLNESKFARLRAYTMPESRSSVSRELYALAEESSQMSSKSGRGSGDGSTQSKSNPSSSIGVDGKTSPATLHPILLIPMPNKVHHSQEYYERASAFQFPREDPLELRRQISDRRRTQSNWLGIADGVAQSAPAAGDSHMEAYQKYRQQQIMAHNQMAPAEQQQQLFLGSPRRLFRSLF